MLEKPAPRPETWRPELPSLDGEPTVIVDFETTGLRWWDGDRPIGCGYYLPNSRRGGYIPWGHRGGGNLDETVCRFWLHDEFKGKHVVNVNTKFDVHMAQAWGVDLTESWRQNTFGDVAHYAALLDDHRVRFNLEDLSKDILGLLDAKVKLQASEIGFAHLPAWEVAARGEIDCRLVAQLKDAMQPEILAENLDKVLNLEERVIPVVVEMEKNGAWLDVDTLTDWRAKARAEYEQSLFDVMRLVGFQVNPDSGKDLAKLFKHLRIPITQFTPTGQPSFTDAVMKTLAPEYEPIAKLRRAGQLADLLSKYLDKYYDTMRSDGWIRFNLHQLRTIKQEGQEGGAGVVSGRFSSAGDQFGGFNCQQVVAVEKQLERGWLPEYVVRRLFIPKEGQWLAADAKQIEYRRFAHYAEDPKLLATYDANPEADFHKVVMDLLQTVVPDINRKRTKNTNFMKIYGGGLAKLAVMLDMIDEQTLKELHARRNYYDDPRVAEAKVINDAYNAMFPSVAPLLKLAADTARDRGYVCTLLGRRARFRKGDRYYSALNRIIQGTAAEDMKSTLVTVYEQRKDLELTLRMTVHDELDADLRNPDRLNDVKSVMNAQRLPARVPILWDVQTGANWAEAK